MAAHYRAGRVRVVQGLVFGVLGIAGSWFGSKMSASVAPAVLLAAFSVLMLVVASMMVVRRRAQRRAAAGGEVEAGSPDGPVLRLLPKFICACPQVLKVLVTASAVGLLTGFFGVGGGFAVVPALVLVLGFTDPVAVGTSLLVIAINSASALVSRVGHRFHLDFTLIGVFTLAAIVGSLLGGRLATRVCPERLTAAFTMLLVAVALYTAARSSPAGMTPAPSPPESDTSTETGHGPHRRSPMTRSSVRATPTRLTSPPCATGATPAKPPE